MYNPSAGIASGYS